ncbi:hypothetical protein HYC85_029760 [Camellia sinensis]|uniref:Uncharacterized protein n=1 Tax=Camellia sinensis TaxID=4442 RepID=A0A7J7FZ01_CAMSI|nr:hypothetical protein HYC85_029760 [Camellia sinensis]
MEKNDRETMEKNDKETMESNDKAITTDEPEINYRGIKAMPFIIGNETFEKLGAIGTLANLLVYLTTVFNMKAITATTLINVFNGTTNFGTLLGAYLSDTYFGRYKTLGFASIASFLGLLVIALTAAIKKLHPPHCASHDESACIGPTARQMAFLLLGFALVAVGAGGIRPCNLAFGADQFNPNTESGKRGINSFFNWITNSRNAYVDIVCILLPGDKHICESEARGFLDKAAIRTPDDQINPNGSSANLWRLCTMQQVEEVKCVLRVIPIWASAILYFVALVQQQTFVVFQALQSNRHFGKTKFQIPAASYPVFSMLTMSLWIPIYDRILVPTLRRFTGKEGGITILQRMGIGIGLSALTSLVAAFIENWRRTTALTMPTLGIEQRRGAISSINALWLVPQLSLAGLAEAFMSIGQVEFYYKQFPENMRSIAGSSFFCGMAVSNYLSGFLVSVVHKTTQRSGTGGWLTEDLNKGRLDYFYYLVATSWGHKFGVLPSMLYVV